MIIKFQRQKEGILLVREEQNELIVDKTNDEGRIHADRDFSYKS
jgi:hypothetical protein